MEDVLKMDIFFFIATLALVIVTLFVCVFLYFAIRLVRTADRLAHQVEKEALALKTDIDDMRIAARKNIGQFFTLISTARKFLLRFIEPKVPRD